MKNIMIILLVIILQLIPSIVYAQCPCDNNGSPPQLDEQQATRWINANPWERPYLARLWEVSPKIAEFYGAQYKMPVCGLNLANGSFSGGDSSTNPYIQQSRNEIDTRWDIGFKQVSTFVPITIEYPKLETPQEIKTSYNAPPSLDYMQSVRWGQALPSARPHLARLWDIPVLEAVKYGAEY